MGRWGWGLVVPFVVLLEVLVFIVILVFVWVKKAHKYVYSLSCRSQMRRLMLLPVCTVYKELELAITPKHLALSSKCFERVRLGIYLLQ